MDDDDDDDGIDADDEIGHIMLGIAQAEVRDFEHRRVLSSIRQSLLGTGRPLVIHDRYQVVRRLGSGGMGEVYLCEDEQLHRQVAVKFVRGSGNSHDQSRLRREAQTLAPLSHPNLVVAFDVGEHEGRTFLAMEYIEGQTLAHWLGQRRPWREVLARFIHAGRGLAAAHRAGVVHRDFKPANVLLGKDGAVKVADFGLALVEGHTDPHDEDARLSTADDSLEPRWSMVGAAGTARYMSLEQLAGLSVDARSDQFGFCLALYEGLWGEAPFADSDVRARREALSRGKPKAPSRSHGLWGVIRRGLARDPGERWPSMDALLVALEQVPQRRRWIVRSAAGVVMGLGVGIAFVESHDVCEGVDQELVGVWDERTRSELEQHFATLDAEHVPLSSRFVLEGIDHWSAAWLAEREQVCRARESRVMKDRPTLSTRDECLDRQREHVESLVDTLTEANAAELAHAVVVVAELPEPASCVDEPPLRIEPPPPTLAARVAFVRQEIARARELRRLGRFEQARERARAADAAARGIDYGPLHAEARAELARMEDETGSPEQSAKLYDEAIELAEIHYHDRLVAELRIERAELSLFDLRDAEHGEEELRRAEIAWERVGGPDAWARSRLAFGRGRVHELGGVRAKAQTSYRDAVELAREVENPDLPIYLDALARVVDSNEEARSLRFKAREFARKTWGPDHPRTAKATFDLALLEAGQDGEPQLETTAEIWLQVYKQPHPKLAKAHFLFARAALQRGEFDKAKAHARSMQNIQSEVLPKRDPARGEPEQLLAKIDSVRGYHEPALVHARAALRWFELAGPDDPGAMSMRQLIIDELLALDRLDEAEQKLESMLEIEAHPTIPVRLQWAELAVRRNYLEDADLRLRDIAMHGDHSFTYEFLRALVDLRLGRLEPVQVERMQAARAASSFTLDQLAPWFEQLGLTANERGRLALPD